MKIAVVHHDEKSRVLARRGRPNPEPLDPEIRHSVVDALRSHGHEVYELRGDTQLPSRLAVVFDLAPHRYGGAADDLGAVDEPVDGLVIDLAYGIQGQARYTHIPALLELIGVPYLGSDPRAHVVALDKALTRTVLQAAGVPVPEGAAIRIDEHVPDGLPLPAVVKPQHEAASVGLSVVRDRTALEAAVADIHTRYNEAALVERYIAGHEIYIGVLGDDPMVALPPVECVFLGEGETEPGAPTDPERPKVFSQDQKEHKRDQFRMHCPADLPADVQERAKDVALQAARAAGVRDLARIDLRIDVDGQPYVLEINSIPGMHPEGPFALSARVAGLPYPDLLEFLISRAAKREKIARKRSRRIPTLKAGSSGELWAEVEAEEDATRRELQAKGRIPVGPKEVDR